MRTDTGSRTATHLVYLHQTPFTTGHFQMCSCLAVATLMVARYTNSTTCRFNLQFGKQPNDRSLHHQPSAAITLCAFYRSQIYRQRIWVFDSLNSKHPPRGIVCFRILLLSKARQFYSTAADLKASSMGGQDAMEYPRRITLRHNHI